MSEKNYPPYVPFYKPYGMSDEEYEYEVRQAEQRLAEWESLQEEIEKLQGQEKIDNNGKRKEKYG